MQSQINAMVSELAQLQTRQSLNHAENRQDILELRQGQNNFAAALQAGMERIAESLEKALIPIKKDILDLQMWKSKTTGYVLGVTALAALVFKLVELAINHVGVK